MIIQLNDGLQFAVWVEAGAKVLLRGASGAGKSTLIDLLRRFVEPDEGRILVDGLPLADLRLEDLRRRLACAHLTAEPAR